MKDFIFAENIPQPCKLYLCCGSCGTSFNVDLRGGLFQVIFKPKHLHMRDKCVQSRVQNSILAKYK